MKKLTHILIILMIALMGLQKASCQDWDTTQHINPIPFTYYDEVLQVPQINIPERESFYDRIPESFKVIVIFSTSVVLDAVSDAWIADNKNVVLAHSIDAVNIGMLLLTPFILDIDRDNWGWYLASYVSFRIALFDLTYNHMRGLPFEYRNEVTLWDKALTELNPPPGAMIFCRSLVFTLAISIPISEIR